MVPRAALIDSGAESVLAAGWLADLVGIDPAASEDRATIGIGGQVVEVAFVEVELRLHHVHDAEQSMSWRADVGFVPGWLAPFPVVLGQVGFLDTFTVTFSRGAAMAAVEDWDAFDNRFGTGAPI